MRKNSTRHAGQAATEFLIAAVFLLVPLFLTIPLLGKYIDIKHAAIGQARYSAWEYTVWRANDTRLLFGDLNAADYGNPKKTIPLNPLWRDHRGQPLFAEKDMSVSIDNGKTPGKLFGDFLDFVGSVFAHFGDLLSAIGVKNAKADFIDRLSYYTSDVNIRVRPLDRILPRSTLKERSDDKNTCLNDNSNCLTIKARAAVLTNNWNARNPASADAESRGLVVTSLLSPLSTLANDLIKPINRGLSHIPGFDIKLPGVPNFGYVKDDLIPYEHRYNPGVKLQEKQGLSSYE